MQDDGELASNGNGGALEADLLAQLHAPAPQVTVSVAAGQWGDVGYCGFWIGTADLAARDFTRAWDTIDGG